MYVCVYIVLHMCGGGTIPTVYKVMVNTYNTRDLDIWCGIWCGVGVELVWSWCGICGMCGVGVECVELVWSWCGVGVGRCGVGVELVWSWCGAIVLMISF